MIVVRGAGIALLALLVTACGDSSPSRSHHPIRNGAEPALSPAPARRPAGRSFRVGALPEGIVLDSRTDTLAVATRDPSSIVLIDPRSDHIRMRIPIPAPARHLALAGPGGPLLVPAGPAGELLELSLRTGRYTVTKVGSLPHDSAATGGRIFVGNEFGGSVSVLQGTRVVRTIGGFTQPGGLTATGDEIGLVDVGADTLSLIDGRSLRVVARAHAGAGPTHDVADAAGSIFVIDTRGDAVLRFAARPTLRERFRLALLGKPYGVAIDPRRDRLWVTLTAIDQLVELSTAGDGLRVLARYPTGRQPDTVTVDPATGAVFVADAAAGVVERIDP